MMPVVPMMMVPVVPMMVPVVMMIVVGLDHLSGAGGLRRRKRRDRRSDRRSADGNRSNGDDRN